MPVVNAASNEKIAASEQVRQSEYEESSHGTHYQSRMSFDKTHLEKNSNCQLCDECQSVHEQIKIPKEYGFSVLAASTTHQNTQIGNK